VAFRVATSLIVPPRHLVRAHVLCRRVRLRSPMCLHMCSHTHDREAQKSALCRFTWLVLCGAMAPKVAPKAAAKVAPRPLRPANGRAATRGLLGRFAKPRWLRRVDQLQREDLITANTSQIVTIQNARHTAEYLLRQSVAEQGRLFHILALYRNNSLRRILREYDLRRRLSWNNVNRAVLDDGTVRTRPLVISSDGVVMS
jgi:hypothetical protein